MLKSELELGIDDSVSEAVYDVVNTVYMYYPGMNDKEQVYHLYKTYGFIIFRDMYLRARKIADRENSIQKLLSQINDIRKEIENLKNE